MNGAGEPAETVADVGVIGLGQMGRPIARRLLSAGRRVIAWGRTPGEWERLADAGAVIARDPAQVMERAAVVLTSLPDEAAVRAVALGQGGLASGSNGGGLVVDLSTLTPDGARSLAADLGALGIGYLDAPVSGGVSGAAAGTLTVMVGGDEADLERARPILDLIAGRIVHCGGHGAGQVAKACNQLIVMTTLGAVAEALVLARASGLDPATVRAALMGGYAASPILDIQGERMLRRDFSPGGKTVYNLKDIGTIRGLEQKLGVSLPVFEAAAGQLIRLIEDGGAELDNSAVITVVERAAEAEAARSVATGAGSAQ